MLYGFRRRTVHGDGHLAVETGCVGCWSSRNDVILVGGLASYALFNIGFWAEEITRLQEGLAYLNSAGKADQKLAGWSDKLSSLMEFVPKMDSALWALIGISGGTTVF